MLRLRIKFLATGVGVTIAAAAMTAGATCPWTTSTVLTVEAVSCYGNLPDGGAPYDCAYPTLCPNAVPTPCASEYDTAGGNIHAVDSAEGWISTLNTYSDTVPWTVDGTITAYPWYNLHVWDTDLYDPQLSTAQRGDDDTYADNPNLGVGVGMAFWQGHGACDDIPAGADAIYGGTYPCDPTESDSCPAGYYCPGGTLPSEDGVYSKACIQQVHRAFHTFGPAAHKTRGDRVQYGTDYETGYVFQSIAQGEDCTSGSFDGAGTNGGANLVVFQHSCGFRTGGSDLTYLQDETAKFFAGVHAVLGVAPVQNFVRLDGDDTVVDGWYDDTLDDPNFGANLAYWVSALPDAAICNGIYLAGYYGFDTGEYGGGAHNYPSDTNADGVMFVAARDWYPGGASFHANTETWNDSISEGYDAIANTYFAANVSCNYDCSLGY